MIEKREKCSENFQIRLRNSVTEKCSTDNHDECDAHVAPTVTSIGNNDDTDTAKDLTEIASIHLTGDINDECMILLSENSHASDFPACESDAALISRISHDRIENTDESASCINTRNFSSEQVELEQEDESSSSDEDDRESVLTTKYTPTSQDPIEIRDNSSSHADDLKGNGSDEDSDTKHDDTARNDDEEKTSDCNDDQAEKSDTKSLETNESTTFNDQEQRLAFYKTENLMPLKEGKCFFEQLNFKSYQFNSINNQL